MPIKILDTQVISRIAAGEVVERPASVVKELVENSLDAGSNQISIETRGGGVSFIRVTDNGVGIPSSELELAFQRHATSKVSSIDDLDSISSLGFRGEALPSIAAVAEVEIVTCTDGDSSGSSIKLQDGNVMGQGNRGRSRGTTVTIRNLLRNVPARLKFLKSTATENGHIANIATQYALAYPEVKFNLIIEGRTVLNTPGSSRLIDCIIEVYGMEIARNMLEIGNSEIQWKDKPGNDIIKVNGMIGSPAVSRSSRDYLSFFINRRWVNSRLLSWAVEEAYHGLLMQGRHPVAVVNITIPIGDVDINIHPTKTEVKFQNERNVFSAVQKAVRQALIEMAPVPRIEDVAATYTARSASSPSLLTPTWAELGSSDSSPSVQTTPAFSLPALRLLGQLNGSYIIAEGPDGLYIIDQHAAHERILFEKFSQQKSSRQVEVQGLLEPVTLEVSPGQDEVFKSNYENMVDFGFSIEPFGDRAYLVRTVPALIHRKDWMGMLRELLDSPPEGGNSDWSEKLTVSMACHGAIKAGQALSNDEMREMIKQLEQTALPNTCPHGRPTMIHLSSGQLEKEFRRT